MKHNKNNLKNKSSQNKRYELLIFSVLLILLVLSMVMIIRLNNNKPAFPTGESYYNLRIANSLKQDLFLNKDPVQETVYEPNPYHYLLALLFIILPFKLVSLFLPVILGVISALLFFKLLRSIKVKPVQSAHSLILLAVTPAFIVIFTQLSIYGFAIFLSLSALTITLSKRKLCSCFAVLLFMLLALTSLTSFIITILLLFFILLSQKKNMKVLIQIIITSLTAVIVLTLISNYVPKMLGFHAFAFKEVFSILNAQIGFDIFLIFLFLTGFILIWISDKERKLLYLPVLLLIIMSFFNLVARIYASLIIPVYCVIAITYLYKRKWDLQIVRTGTLLLVMCSLLFSLVNQANFLMNAKPDKQLFDALTSLRAMSKGKVLSLEENGFLIEYYSAKPAMLDSNSFLSKNYEALTEDSAWLFGSVRLIDAEPLLKQHELHYILITPDMKGELWEDREQGLWFLVKHSESFIKKYDQQGIEIWEYASPN